MYFVSPLAAHSVVSDTNTKKTKPIFQILRPAKKQDKSPHLISFQQRRGFVGLPHISSQQNHQASEITSVTRKLFGRPVAVPSVELSDNDTTSGALCYRLEA